MATAAARLRARLDRPIIDADGHLIEHLPALLPMIVDEGVAPSDLHNAHAFFTAHDPTFFRGTILG